MESKTERISLMEAMSDAHVKEIPAELKDNKKIWVKAIVKVIKCNSKKNYALAINKGDGTPEIVKDYGDAARIVKVESIYPYYYLEDRYIPDLRNKQDIIAYLDNSRVDVEVIKKLLSTEMENGEKKSEEQRKADKEIVKKTVIKTAINNCIIEIEERRKSRRSYNELISKSEGENKEGDTRDYVTNPEQ